MTRTKNNDWDAVIFKPELKRFSGTRQQDKAHIVAHVNRTNRESITESCRRFTHTLLFVVNIILPCTLSTKLPSCHLQCDHTVSISSVNSPPMSSAWAECLSPIRGIIRGEAYENPKCTDACGVMGVAGGWNIKMTGCLFLLFRCEWNVTNMVQLQQLDQHPGLYSTKTEVCHHKWFKRKEGREGSLITHTHVRARAHTHARVRLQAHKKWVISEDEKGLLEGLIASDEKQKSSRRNAEKAKLHNLYNFLTP